MLRLYDFECQYGHHFDDMVNVPDGEKPRAKYRLQCKLCGRRRRVSRLMSAPAKYLGDRPMSPHVYGGQFDTMGGRSLPHLPEFPDDGTGSDFRDFVNQKSYKEIKRERRRVQRENAAKRKRAAAAKRDPNLSFRHTRLSGDPSYS